MQLLDSLTSFTENLLQPSGRAALDHYGMSTLQPMELASMYRQDWLARKIVEIPARDATREWRLWNASGDEQSKIERAEKKLRLMDHVNNALRLAALYGGALLLIGDGAEDPTQPLDVEKIGLGGIKYLHVFDRESVSYSEVNRDISSEWFGEPVLWSIPADNTKFVDVHPSRVIKFIGAELDDNAYAISDGVWGDSILQAANMAVRNVARMNGAIAELVHDAKSDIVKVPNLAEMLATEEGTNKMVKRFQAAHLIKGIYGSLLIGENEEWDQRQYDFKGIPEIMIAGLQVAAGAADIPLTRLAGMSPGGMNSTGDSDLINYYDAVGSKQEIDITPCIDRLDQALVRHALGSYPEGLFYNWRPLWKPTAQQKAEISTKRYSAVSVLARTNLVDPEALRRAIVPMLAEDDLLPGIEQHVEDVIAERESGLLPPTPAELEHERLSLEIEQAKNGQLPTDGDEGQRKPTKPDEGEQGKKKALKTADRLVQPDDEKRILALLNRAESRIYKSFRDAVQILSSDRSINQILDLMNAGRFDEAMDNIELTMARVASASASSFIASAESEVAMLQQLGLDRVSFNVADREAAQAIETSRRSLMGRLVSAQRDALTAGGEIAGREVRKRELREVMGMSGADARAVQSFRDALTNLDRAALRRVYRDRRFDPSIEKALQSGEPLDPKKIESMVTRYAEKARDARARDVARLEALTAHHEGVAESYRQTIADGVLTADQITQVWNSVGDGRVRSSHTHLDGQERPEGVAFQGLVSQIRYPGDPLADAAERHGCRCYLTRKIDLSEVL